jgi:hypothetical protein
MKRKIQKSVRARKLKRPFLLAFLLLIVACTQQPTLPPPASPTPPPVILHIGVTDSATAVIDLLSPVYPQDNPDIIVQFIVASSSTLAADLQSGQLDAILDHIVPDGLSNWTNPIALDGLVAVVHPTNPVTAVTRSDLQAIFNGRLTNWADVGGADKPITLISPPRSTDSYQLFAERVMLTQRITVHTQIQPTDAALRQAVAAAEGAIGLSMMGNSLDTAVSLLAIDRHLPTTVETAVQSYSLTVPLYFIHATNKEPTGALRTWLAWVQSAAGQELIGTRYGRIR